MTAKRDLPPCVYLKHGAYYLVRDNKWTRLGKDKAAALRSYASLVAQRKGALAEMLIDAVDNRGVKSTTRRRYLGAVKHLAEIFAEFAPADVEPRHVYELQTMLRDSPNVYNSCLTVLRIAYEYGMQRQLVTTDPTIGVNRAREVKRSRLLAACGVLGNPQRGRRSAASHHEFVLLDRATHRRRARDPPHAATRQRNRVHAAVAAQVRCKYLG